MQVWDSPLKCASLDVRTLYTREGLLCQKFGSGVADSLSWLHNNHLSRRSSSKPFDGNVMVRKSLFGSVAENRVPFKRRQLSTTARKYESQSMTGYWQNVGSDESTRNSGPEIERTKCDTNVAQKWSHLFKSSLFPGTILFHKKATPCFKSQFPSLLNEKWIQEAFNFLSGTYSSQNLWFRAFLYSKMLQIPRTHSWSRFSSRFVAIQDNKCLHQIHPGLEPQWVFNAALDKYPVSKGLEGGSGCST